ERREIVGHGQHARRGVGRIVAGHHAQQQRRVGDGARHRPHVVHRPRERQHAGTTDAAVRRLEPGDPAERGGNTDRAARVRPERGGRQSRGDRDTRARRRAARHPRGGGVPRIARGAVVRVEPFGPVGELHHVQLAQHDRSRLLQPPDDGRIGLGRAVGQDLRAARGAHTRGVVEILEGDRNAVQRADGPAGRQRALRGARGGQGGLVAHGDVRAERRVQRRDPLQVHAHHLDRRHLLARDHSRQVGDRGEREVGAHRIRYCVVGSTASSGSVSRVARSRSEAWITGRRASSSSSVHVKPATRAAPRSVARSNTASMARSLSRYAGDRKAALVIRRRTVWLIALIVFVTLASVGVAVLSFAPEIVRHAAIMRLESLTRRRVTIERVELNILSGHVAVVGLRVADRQGPGTLAKVDRIEGRIHRRSLWRLHVWIQDLAIGGTDVRLVRLPSGRLRLYLPGDAAVLPESGVIAAGVTVVHDATGGTRVSAGARVRNVALQRRGQDGNFATSPEITVTLNDLAVKGGDFSVRRAEVEGDLAVVEAMYDPPIRYAFSNTRLVTEDLAWPSRRPGRVALTGGFLNLRKPWATVERDAAGALALRALFTRQAAAGEPVPAEGTRAADVSIGELRVQDGALMLVDATVTPAARLGVSAIGLSVKNAGWPARGPAQIKLEATLPGGGTLTVAGNGELDQRVGRIKVRA